jgi:hypothetical protein
VSNHVEHGGIVRCQFGTSTALLNVSGPIPIASVRDFVPLENIQPFGACVCPQNPQVAAAMVGGVVTPMPCVPAVDAPWSAPKSRIVVAGLPGLSPEATARCRWGGVISLVLPQGR